MIKLHEVEIVEATDNRNYWWKCTCGDEAGPFELYEFAWDSFVAHVKREVAA